MFAYELFICESKSQVYGILHDVMSKWEFNDTGNVLGMEWNCLVDGWVKFVLVIIVHGRLIVL